MTGKRTDAGAPIFYVDRDIEAFFKKKIVRRLILAVWLRRAIENRWIGNGNDKV